MKKSPEREKILKKLRELLTKAGISVSEGDFSPNEFACPYFEVESESFSFIIKERNIFIENRTNLTENELLYFLARTIVKKNALDYELKNRIHGQDFRRLYFEKTIQLMNMIDISWGKDIEKEIEAILSKYPFHDDCFI